LFPPAQAVRIQSCFRTHYHCAFYTDLRSAAQVVQSAWRVCLAYRVRRGMMFAAAAHADEQWSAAAAIQRVWRGHAVRCGPAAAQRARNAALTIAALRVQVAWYKRNKLFPAFVLMRSLYAQHEEEVQDARQASMEARYAAALSIQCMWRGWRTRHRVAWLRHRRRCAWRLERWWRWVRWNRTMRRLLVCVGVVTVNNKAARRLQGWWLRLKPGRMLASLQVGSRASYAHWLAHMHPHKTKYFGNAVAQISSTSRSFATHP
jgi:hypothetical protein